MSEVYDFYGMENAGYSAIYTKKKNIFYVQRTVH